MNRTLRSIVDSEASPNAKLVAFVVASFGSSGVETNTVELMELCGFGGRSRVVKAIKEAEDSGLITRDFRGPKRSRFSTGKAPKTGTVKRPKRERSRSKTGTVEKQETTKNPEKTVFLSENKRALEGGLGGGCDSNTVLSCEFNEQETAQAIKTSNPSAGETQTIQEMRQIFNRNFWPVYPKSRRADSLLALKSFIAAVESGIDPWFIVEQAKRYAVSHVGINYAVTPKDWLDRGKYNDSPESWQEISKSKRKPTQSMDSQLASTVDALDGV